MFFFEHHSDCSLCIELLQLKLKMSLRCFLLVLIVVSFEVHLAHTTYVFLFISEIRDPDGETRFSFHSTSGLL